jgi:hypothetical protein
MAAEGREVVAEDGAPTRRNVRLATTENVRKILMVEQNSDMRAEDPAIEPACWHASVLTQGSRGKFG